MNTAYHIPVLLQEVLALFDPHPGQDYIDATLGDGGHTLALLEHISPDGRVLGLDQDARQVAIAQERLKPYGQRACLRESRFSCLRQVADQVGFKVVDGILFDLGISSRQLDSPDYGLRFEDTARLDMRLSQKASHSAADFLNRANEREIADVLYEFGDRHNSRLLARKVVSYRRKHSFQVARDVKLALGLWAPPDLAPIFQALRIWVNQEYEELVQGLEQALELLKPNGLLVVISFHSGEDRIVKRFLNNHRELLEVSKKVITPRFEEARLNPRARSAKLRYGRRHEKDDKGGFPV